MKWTKVSDGLPELGSDCIVTFLNLATRKYLTAFATFDGNRVFRYYGTPAAVYDVIAWTYPPEPFTEDANDN